MKLNGKFGMTNLFSGIYKNKTVLVTGHTGFKGSWLVYWLEKMGAKVIGYALEAPTQPNHIALLDLDMVSIIGDDINCKELLKNVGFAACPANSLDDIKNIPKIIKLSKSGGAGAVREFVEIILKGTINDQ